MTATLKKAVEDFPILDGILVSPKKVIKLAEYLRTVRDTDPELLEAELAALESVWGTTPDEGQLAAYDLNQHISLILFGWDSEVLRTAVPGLSKHTVANWKHLATRLRALATEIEGVLD